MWQLESCIVCVTNLVISGKAYSLDLSTRFFIIKKF